MKQRTKPALFAATPVSDSGESIRLESIAAAAPAADDDGPGRLGLFQQSRLVGRLPSIPQQPQQQQPQQPQPQCQQLTRHGSAKATVGERSQHQHHQHQFNPQPPQSHQRHLQLPGGGNSLTVGGQPRAGRSLAHSAIIAAASAAAAAAAANGSAVAAVASGNGQQSSQRQFSVKRVDEASAAAGESAPAASAAASDSSASYSSKSELLESRRQQLLRQHPQSSNAVPSSQQPELTELSSCGDAEAGDGDAVNCDDLCPLCDTCVKNSRGRTSGIQLDDNPGVIRWQKLPCDCPDRYLHVSCLEAGFYEDAVYKGGHRRLIIACQVCQAQLLIRRHRGRRACDHQAALSFARHLLSVLLISSFFLGFGLWSLLHPIDGRPTIVNVGLLSIGLLTVLVFACYEIWLLHGRFDFVISRLSGKFAGGGNHNNNNDASKRNNNSSRQVDAAADNPGC